MRFIPRFWVLYIRRTNRNTISLITTFMCHTSYRCTFLWYTFICCTFLCHTSLSHTFNSTTFRSNFLTVLYFVAINIIHGYINWSFWWIMVQRLLTFVLYGDMWRFGPILFKRHYRIDISCDLLIWLKRRGQLILVWQRLVEYFFCVVWCVYRF